MRDAHLSLNSTNAGNCYEIPNGIDDLKFYELMYEFIDLVKVKGLTVRQAQYLFSVC